ncbi:MAG: glycosyltransferase family 8 protein [Anaerolineaceae bacterium]|nr:glycosyltransferase family 8 protein [Anaerolineaceae bacterium]
MYSYVTLVANAEYVIGAIALARSLQMCHAQWPLTALVTGDFVGLDDLESAGCRLLPVASLPLSDDFCHRHSRQQQHERAPFLKGNKPQFHNPLDNFVKLRAWELESYKKIVFLDADTLVIQNIDRLFQFPEFVAAPNVYESLADFHRLNSGVFVAEPSRDTFETLLAALDQPGLFWPRTDQTFLQTFFPDWYGLPYIYNTLQYVWFNLPQLWNWDQIRVIHYQYEKPWETDHPKRKQLAPLIDLWQQVYERARLPESLPVNDVMASL